MLRTLEITGLRGFASKQTLELAVADNKPGSGLTVIVGANNSGKSTALEAMRAIVQREAPSFTQGRRNQAAGDKVTIRAVDTENRSTTLKSIRAGSSETEYVKEAGGVEVQKFLVLPARRVFTPYFGRSTLSRDNYMANIGFPTIRTTSVDQFAYRLFAVEKHRAGFDAILKRVLDPVPEWTIDQLDSGQYFLKVKKGDATHSSEGLGEGLVSLLYIIDALYDSEAGQTIAIDEPELSLHPALQRRLSDVLVEYAATRQIVLATHSPYFVGLNSLPNGATVARTHIVRGESTISQLSSVTAQTVFGLMRNQNNPHILDLLAQEIFFVEDRVILTEGQEDVVFFKIIEADIEPVKGTFFGWGVGGAENMERVATILRELGFAKVVGILDGNRPQLAEQLRKMFPQYHFCTIPADDVRTKDARPQKPKVRGLLDDNNDHVRPECVKATRELLTKANEFLRG